MSDASNFIHCIDCGKRLRRKEIESHECSDEEKSKNLPKKRQGTVDYTNELKVTQIGNKTVIENSSESLASSSSKEEQEQTNLEISADDKSTLPDQDREEEKKENENTSTFLEVDSSQEKQDRKASLPVNALLKDEPKQAWNANLHRRVSGRVEIPKHIKKYRHYPVSCEFCNQKFQPGPLMKHIQERHPDEHLAPSMRGKGKIQAEERQDDDDEHLAHAQKRHMKKKKKAGGMPRQMKICYICGRQYGSQSLKIHEPQCLKKWKIENDKLPKHKRMPEPIKPEPIKVSDSGEKLPGSNRYDHQLPDLNAEAEAAYQSHLRNLVPCEFCKRTFNPDRVMVHENACIERRQTSRHPGGKNAST